MFSPARVLAEVAAKRRIVDRWSALEAAPVGKYGEDNETTVERLTLESVCGLLALPYAEHPDYSADWAPHSM